jgi:hypothetical protein
MRYELSDYEWTAIKPMLPNKSRGVSQINDRGVLNGTSLKSFDAPSCLIDECGIEIWAGLAVALIMCRRTPMAQEFETGAACRLRPEELF